MNRLKLFEEKDAWKHLENTLVNEDDAPEHSLNKQTMAN